MRYTIIPGLPEGRNPESSGTCRQRIWIPGSATRLRNDELNLGANQVTFYSLHVRCAMCTKWRAEPPYACSIPRAQTHMLLRRAIQPTRPRPTAIIPQAWGSGTATMLAVEK